MTHVTRSDWAWQDGCKAEMQLNISFALSGHSWELESSAHEKGIDYNNCIILSRCVAREIAFFVARLPVCKYQV